jgi:hypothetical protein
VLTDFLEKCADFAGQNFIFRKKQTLPSHNANIQSGDPNKINAFPRGCSGEKTEICTKQAAVQTNNNHRFQWKKKKSAVRASSRTRIHR